ASAYEAASARSPSQERPRERGRAWCLYPTPPLGIKKNLRRLAETDAGPADGVPWERGAGTHSAAPQVSAPADGRAPRPTSTRAASGPSAADLQQADPAVSSRVGGVMTRFERITSDPERMNG